MVDLTELQDIDFGDVGTWPIWFRWTMIILVAGGLLFAGYRYIIEPEQKALVKLEKREQNLRDEFLNKKELAINLPAYRKQMVEIRDRFGVVLRQLPNQTEVPALLIDISQAGLSRGLKFRQFKPAQARTEDFYKTLPISITVSGRFHQLAEFISDLASLPRIVTVGNMQIIRDTQKNSRRAKDTKTGPNVLQMKAQLQTYQYLENSGEQDTQKKTRVQG